MRSCWLAAVLIGGSLCATANADPVTCRVTSVAVQVRAEGLAEQLGDVVLTCTGAPGAIVSGNLTVHVPVPVTNRLSAGNVIDAVLTVDTGAGPVSTGATVMLRETYFVDFAGVNFALPASGTAVMRVSNIRAAVAQFGQTGTQIQVLLSWFGSDVAFDIASPTVAASQIGLLAGFSTTVVGCQGSPIPEPVTATNLFLTTPAISTTRVTEGFTSAFTVGTRVLLTFSGFPAGARVFVPNAVAGSDAWYPTKSGLLGGYRTPGAYVKGSGTLVLVRVNSPSPDGSGGLYATAPGLTGIPVLLDSASEVILTNGAGFAVFEVEDQNPLVRENAEIPSWLGLPYGSPAVGAPEQGVKFAPFSTVSTATATDPIPRFLDIAPPQDCSMLGDCASFPSLAVRPDPNPFELTIQSGAHDFQKWVWVTNEGGGVMGWIGSLNPPVTWVTATPIPLQGVNMRFTPAGLAPGIYQTTLTIDAGVAGLANVPVKLTVTNAVPPPVAPSAPVVDQIVHAATLQPGVVVPGSLASILGSHLAGAHVSVSFGALAATLFYTGENQITLQAPPALALYPSARMKVTVDGRTTQVDVNLTPIAPGIFAVLNQDNTLNGPGDAAAGGSEIQIYATGLPLASVGAITAKIHDVWVDTPVFAGPAPGLTGVQLVTLTVPTGWPRMDTSVVVCGTSLATSVRTCSPQAPVSVR
jgi:uncharacterized protein (TIGR03437 family)